MCHGFFSVSFELSAGAHRPVVLHCSELEPRVGLVSSVQHQGLTEQWGEMGRGSDRLSVGMANWSYWSWVCSFFG